MFLEAYAPKYSAKALCICFQDLQQKPNKKVQDFYYLISKTFRNAYLANPNHTVTYAGNLHGTTQAQCNEILLQGVNRMQLQMLNAVFLGGLQEDIRNWVLEEGPNKPDDSVKFARKIESLLNDRCRENHEYNCPEDDEAEDMGKSTRMRQPNYARSMLSWGKRTDLNTNSKCSLGQACNEAPRGQEQLAASTGLGLSSAFSATSLGTRLPNAVRKCQPEDLAEAAHDGWQPSKWLTDRPARNL